MSERIENHYCIKFCHKLGARMLTIKKIPQTFGDEAMGISQIKKRFEQGQILVVSKPRFGRWSTNRNEEFIANVHRTVEDDRRITLNEIFGEVGLKRRNNHCHNQSQPRITFNAADLLFTTIALQKLKVRIYF